MTYHYLPPAPEEARAFALQFVGTLAGIAFLALAWTRLDEASPMLLGALIALLYLLVRAAWALETKARRAQVGEIEVGDEGVRFRDEKSEQIWAWSEIELCEVRGGRLVLGTRHGKEMVEKLLSSREIEDGMQLIGEVAARWKNGGKVPAPGFSPPTNFIPLSPR